MFWGLGAENAGEISFYERPGLLFLKLIKAHRIKKIILRKAALALLGARVVVGARVVGPANATAVKAFLREGRF